MTPEPVFDPHLDVSPWEPIPAETLQLSVAGLLSVSPLPPI